MRCAALLFCCAAFGATALAAPDPRFPCGADPFPAYAREDERAAVAVWRAAELPRGWTPPACTRWRARKFTALIAVSGRLRATPDISVFLRRIGAISRTRAISYWSYSRKAWRTLFEEAHALKDPDSGLGRDDFRLSELVAGADLYVWQKEDAPVSGTILRMRFLEISPDHFVLAQENMNATRLLVFKVLGVGDYEAVVMLSRHAGDVWNYYHVIRYGDGARPLSDNQRASLINRAVAAFRYLGDLRMDREPPAAP